MLSLRKRESLPVDRNINCAPCITHAVCLLLVVLSATWIGCHESRQRQVPPPNNTAQQRPTPPAPDASRMVSLVEAQLACGPRVPGTQSHDSCRRLLVAQLRPWVDTVFEQQFVTAVYGKNYRCTNILARLFPARVHRVLLCAHWDSRPRADEDPTPSNRSKPIPGANDGASGVAVVLELVRLLHQHPPRDVGIDVAFFDAEDMGAASDEEMFCLGSKHFAQNFPFPIRPRYGILFDLVGDIQAQFPMEYNSYRAAESLVERLWRIGSIYGAGRFVQTVSGSVVDDHLPLIESGIPTVNIIDLELVGNRSPIARRRYWHTLADDMRNISGETLSSVARVVLSLLYSDSPFPL